LAKKITYKQSGVDVHAGYRAVQAMARDVKKTQIPGVLKSPGSFFSLFELPKGYKNPVLVAATDGVGTKLLLAFKTNIHHTVGVDLVAMSVNDLICCGAKPLFFLDYIAIHQVEPRKVANIVKGIAQGCRLSGCALVGGETAELRELYAPNHYDLAGFAVGVVEKHKIINGSSIAAGDVVLGLMSSGLHSNGYSLARKVLGPKFYREMLTPTQIYVKEIQTLIKNYEIKGIANITGGGLPEKLGRILPKGTGAIIDPVCWEPLPIFKAIEKTGKVAKDEMFHAFNMGIGMAIVVSAPVAAKILTKRPLGDRVKMIGEIVKGNGVEILL
jgi:phosphoribosylformylglycinamidine cyclo-ligase